MNIIDLCSVSYVLVYIIFNALNKFDGNDEIFNIFRFYRCILICRIFRLCQHLDYMNFIMEVILKSFMLFFNLAFLFSIVLIFFSLLGREFFKDYFIYSDKFKTFSTSFIAVFQIVTLDNWFDLLTNEQLSLNQAIYLSIYIIALIFIGNYLFLNLFLTIIIEIFQNKQEEQNEEKIEQNELIMKSYISSKTPREKFEKRRKAIKLKTRQVEMEINSAIKSMQMSKYESKFSNLKEEDDDESLDDVHFSEESERNVGSPNHKEKMRFLERFVNNLETEELKKSENYSLFIFRQDNFLRIKVQNILENFYWTLTIRILLWLHLILKGLDTCYLERNYFYSNTTYEHFSLNMEFGIFVFFTAEIALNIFAYGLFLGPKTYFQKYSNLFSFILVICFFMGMKATEENFITYVNYYIFISLIKLKKRD